MPYNHRPRKAVSQQMESGQPAMGLTDETWSIRASKSLSRNAPNDVRTPRSGCTDDKSVGTDFRYAVEFSKYGRTPATTSRPFWGQPWKHYAVRFAVSTARPSSPLPPLPVRRPRPILTDPVIGGSRSPALKVRIGATRRTVRTVRRESQTVAGAPISAHRRTDRRRSGAH